MRINHNSCCSRAERCSKKCVMAGGPKAVSTFGETFAYFCLTFAITSLLGFPLAFTWIRHVPPSRRHGTGGLAATGPTLAATRD